MPNTKSDNSIPSFELTAIQKINICTELVQHQKEKNSTPVEYIKQVSKLASQYGIPNDTILSTVLKQRSKSLNESEIKQYVKKNITTESKSNLIEHANNLLDEDLIKRVLSTKSILKAKFDETESNSVRSENKYQKIVRFINENYGLRFNKISKELEIKKLDESKYSQLRIEDLECILYENDFSGFGAILKSILGSTTHVEEYDPLEAYLYALPIWDQTKPDYIIQLANFVDTDDNPWFRIQFKKMLVRCLACSLGLIEYNKQVFCLVGNKQNVGKTTFLRFLCPDELKSFWQENLMLQDKDSLKALASNIFILMDEVQSFGFNQLQTIKSRISLASVKMRLPYAKSETIMNRIVNFFATTNDEELLTDDQNVRWLVFKVNSINHDNGGKNGYSKNCLLYTSPSPRDRG